MNYIYYRGMCITFVRIPKSIASSQLQYLASKNRQHKSITNSVKQCFLLLQQLYVQLSPMSD